MAIQYTGSAEFIRLIETFAQALMTGQLMEEATGRRRRLHGGWPLTRAFPPPATEGIEGCAAADEDNRQGRLLPREE